MKQDIKVNEEIHQIFKDLYYKHHKDINQISYDFGIIKNLTTVNKQIALNSYIYKLWGYSTWECSDEEIQSQVLRIEEHIKKYLINYHKIEEEEKVQELEREQKRKQEEIEEEERNKRIANIDDTLREFSKKHSES